MFLNKLKRIKEILSLLAKSDYFVYSIFSIFSLLLAVSIWLFFPVSSSGVHYYSLGLYILLAIGIAIFISYKKDLSIPLIKTILKQEHRRIKTKHSGKVKKLIIIKIYLKVLHYLILLFKNSQESFEDLKEDIFDEFSGSINRIKGKNKKRSIFARVCLMIIRYIVSLFKNSKGGFDVLKDNAFVKIDELLDKTAEEKVDDRFERVRQMLGKIQKKESLDKDSLSELEKELFEFSKFKQKKVTVFSLTAITALIITTVTAGLISSFLFPEVFRTRAASYGFAQTSWAGGASSDNATHSDQTGWTKYFSKDNVSTTTPTELKLSLTTTTIFTQTSDSDWQTHATSSTYYSGGSVGVLRPDGSTCSANVECSSGYCYVDADGDRYAPTSGTATCNASSQLSNVDCNDGNASIYPTTTGGSTCSYCNTDGSITYQTNAQDLFNECTASGCTTTGNCSGTGYSCGGNAAVDTDPDNACSATTCTDYIYGWSGNNCAKYSGSSSHNGMCNGSGACYTTVADSCSGAGSTSASCGSAGCLMACVAGSLATSYDSIGEICYASDKHSCSTGLVCYGTGTCQAPKRVFVTSITYATGNLGGLAGGDTKCQTRANAASLGGTWKAWLSTDTVAAKDRIQDYAYYLVDNTTKVVDSKTDLIDGSLDNAINKSETGSTISGYVWTGSLASGEVSPTQYKCCVSWTDGGNGWGVIIGDSSSATATWTVFSNGVQACNSVSEYLYCFEN